MLVEAILLLGLLALLMISSRKPSRMPPGSFGFPVVGELPARSVSVTQHFQALVKARGKIFTTKWGSHPVVVVTDFSLIKKAFNHPDLQGRPHFFSFALFTCFENAGIIDSDGFVWSENRRFLLRHLRDLGMGKTALEVSIQEEAAMLVDHLEKTCVGKPAVMDASLNGAVLNVIWQMLASTRYDVGAEEVRQYSKMVDEHFAVMHGPMLLVDVIPCLAKVLPTYIMNKIMKMHVLIEVRDSFRSMFKEVVKDHLNTLDVSGPRDVVDQFLLAHPGRDDTGYITAYDENNLFSIMGDMFVAGSETTSSSLRWVVLYMAVYPEVQAKIHKRLDEVVPKERLPSLNDRSQLQYVDAALLDVLRLSSLAPVGLPHRATADLEFEGYIIPKDTLVVASSEMCHHDPAVWEEPNKLHPEHFLDQDGNLDGKKDNFLPFSVGRRQCLGESLARMELFLFSTAILQRFTIEPPEGVTIVPESNPSEILFNFPKRAEVVLRKRI